VLKCPGCGQQWQVTSGRLIAALLAFAMALLGIVLWLDFGFGVKTLTSSSTWVEYASTLIVALPAILFVMWAAPRLLHLVPAG